MKKNTAFWKCAPPEIAQAIILHLCGEPLAPEAQDWWELYESLPSKRTYKKTEKSSSASALNGKKGGRPKKAVSGNTEKETEKVEQPKIELETPSNSSANTPKTDESLFDNTIITETPQHQKRARSAAFQKPTVAQVKEFIREKGYNFDAEAFVGYYESNGWRVGKNPMKSWQGACACWNRNSYGYNKKEPSLSDFRYENFKHTAADYASSF